MNRRIIVGMSGASGALLTVLLMKELKRCSPETEIHLIMTEKAVFGKPITATAITLDHGYQVTIFGGTRTHIGATTMADEEGHFTSVSFPGHKEQVITESWANPFLPGSGNLFV